MKMRNRVKRKIGFALVIAMLIVMIYPGVPSSASEESNGFVLEGTTVIGYVGAENAITIPDGITAIGDSAFQNTSITSVIIPSSVTSIGAYAFAGCTSLTEVVVPASVGSIGEGAFYGCTSLGSARWESSAGIPNSAFADCVGLTSFTYSSALPSVGEEAFKNCRSLASFAIPAGTSSIATSAFDGCSNMSSISVDGANPNYTSYDNVLYTVGGVALYRCPQGSASVTIHDGTTMIGSNAFYGCRLGTVTMPSSVTTVSSGAFDSSEVQKLVLTENVSTFEEQTGFNVHCIEVPGSSPVAEQLVETYGEIVITDYEEDEPENPDDPDEPENPDNPDEPENPDQPTDPDDPDSPDDGGNTGGGTGNAGGNTGNTGDNSGDTGNTGNNGGSTGNTGGDTGNTGNNGGSTGNNSGSTGNTGNSGSTGNTGSAGNNNGSTGNTGSTGNNSGSAGNTGSTGSNSGSTGNNSSSTGNNSSSTGSNSGSTGNNSSSTGSTGSDSGSTGSTGNNSSSTGSAGSGSGSTGTTSGSNSSTTVSQKGTPCISTDKAIRGWDAIYEYMQAAENGATIYISMNGATIVPKEILALAQEKVQSLYIDMGSGISWKIYGKDIISDNIKDIDFEVKLGTGSVPSALREDVADDSWSTQMHLSYDGVFGLTGILTVNLGKEKAGYNATLYYYNEEEQKMEYIDREFVKDNGNVSFSFVHASDYVIVLDGLPKGAAAVTTVGTSVDNGSGAKDDTPSTGQGLNAKYILCLGVMLLGVYMVLTSKKDEDYQTA